MFDADDGNETNVQGPGGRRAFNCLEVKKDLEKNGANVHSGIYIIYVGDDFTALSVRCDMETENGGWTVCINLHRICSVLS